MEFWQGFLLGYIVGLIAWGILLLSACPWAILDIIKFFDKP
jgi:hypothetical protein